MNKTAFTQLIKHAQASMSRHSPEILLGIGIAGMLTSTVLAVKATPKELALIEEQKQEKHTDKLTPLETVKSTWKCYIPAVITGATSIACLVGSSSVQAKRTAAIATAYKVSETALAEYKEKIVQNLGERKEKAIREEIAGDKVEKIPVKESVVYATGDGMTTFLDPLSERHFLSDINRVKKAQNDLNERMLKDIFGYVSVNELYDELGLPRTTIGDELGWCIAKGKIDIDFSSRIDDGKPVIVLDYLVAPRWDYTTAY